MKADLKSAEEMVRSQHRDIREQASIYERTLDDKNKVQAEIAKMKGDLESLGE